MAASDHTSKRMRDQEHKVAVMQHPTYDSKKTARLLQKRDGLHARNFKALAAADILAGHHIIATNHVRLGLGELGPIAFISPRRQLPFLGAHQP